MTIMSFSNRQDKVSATKRPLLGYILLGLFALSIVYAFLLSLTGKSSATTAEVMPFAIGLLCPVVLWYWMFSNLIANRKKITHPILWGLFLLIASIFAGIVYFFVKYTPSETDISYRRIRNWIIRDESYSRFYLKLALLCLVGAFFHFLITDITWKVFSLYNYDIYLKIDHVIYYPLSSFLRLIYPMLGMDTGEQLNWIIFARTLRFIYTWSLLFIIVTAFYYSDKQIVMKGTRNN